MINSNACFVYFNKIWGIPSNTNRSKFDAVGIGPSGVHEVRHANNTLTWCSHKYAWLPTKHRNRLEVT